MVGLVVGGSNRRRHGLSSVGFGRVGSRPMAKCCGACKERRERGKVCVSRGKRGRHGRREREGRERVEERG